MEINLHAFLINVSGIWDNWAWTFVYRHDLEAEFKDRKQVGLFTKKMMRFFPRLVVEKIESQPFASWHERYLKNYRDALAHRIPPYIPPFLVLEGEKLHYQDLLVRERESVKQSDWGALAEVQNELGELGRPCFEFLHSFSEEGGTKSIALHSQLICDAMTVVEFGNLFLDTWHERSYDG